MGGSLIAHVDGILYACAIEFILLVANGIRQFRVGEIEALTKDQPTTFTGLGILYSNNNHAVVSQKQYISELRSVGISQYANQNKLVIAQESRSTFRHVSGARIRAHQLRPDVGLLIAKPAADLITTRTDVAKEIALSKLYTKIAKIPKIILSEFTMRTLREMQME